jgi:hypothetical protein
LGWGRDGKRLGCHYVIIVVLLPLLILRTSPDSLLNHS